MNSNTNENGVINNGDPAFRLSIKPPPNPAGNNCKPSIDSLMLIYHMIQVDLKKKNQKTEKIY